MAVIIETSVGQMTIDLYTDDRPRCSKNFLKLCKVKYYNFSLFHSVQQNLVAQTGDPTATGRGGMSVYGMVYGEQARYFDMEVTPRIKHKTRGLLSMVNNGNGKHGSQFFITLGQDLDYLDGEHTVFGEVAEGFEVLDKLNEAYCDEKHRPYRDIRIFHTVVIDDPFDDPDGLVIPDKSPEPTQEMLESDRIGVDEEVDDTKGMTQEEVQELHAEREAKANAQLLEMVGDIPDIDAKPPDNVLFVCKLNPVTTDEDLEMIFSRFGPIVSCEVIKDHKTKESLQYAFVEFEKPEHCENAYFKMDNVLIDDRRIHVDFSQSVSKLKPPVTGKKVEEEKEDQPRYVLKDQQRRDNNYDLVFEHDFAEASTDTKKPKKHKHHRHSDSEDEGGDSKDKKKKRDKALSNDRQSHRSPHRPDTDRDRGLESTDTHHRQPLKSRRQSSSSPEDRRKRDRKTTPSSEEYGRRDRRKERSPSTEEDRRKEQRRKGASPSSREKERKKKKERSPSSEKDRKKEKKKKKDRSVSPEKDRRKEKKKKHRSPSPEERRTERRRRERSSSEEDRRREKKRKNRSPSSEEDRKKERRKKRSSSSPEEDRRKKRKNRSPSPSEIRKKKKKERRRSPSSGEEEEEDRRRKKRKEERRREEGSSGSHRDRYERDRR